ncbi:hypothetical protein ACFLU6_08065, partial [Acidobacteriota bacterium]
AVAVSPGLVRVNELRWEDMLLEHRLANSEGFDAWYAETLCMAWLAVTAERRGTMVSTNAIGFHRSADSLDVTSLGREAG